LPTVKKSRFKAFTGQLSDYQILKNDSVPLDKSLFIYLFMIYCTDVYIIHER